MARIPIALELYSIRDDCAKDLPGSLAKVAKMGYEGVEFAGFHGRPATEIKAMLDDLGLRMAGSHTPYADVQPDRIQATIEYNRTIGNTFLIVPGIPAEKRKTAADWDRLAESFNGVAETLKPHGMVTGYHNHAVEFQPLDGRMPWDIFFAGTRKEVVMQVDTGNCMHGGGDPMEYLERYPGRARTVHLKEHSKSDSSATLGRGDVPWPRVFEYCENRGATEWYIVEYEVPGRPPMACVEDCLRQLKAWGK